MSARPAALYTIPSGVSFVDALARGLLSRLPTEPLALSTATILLPTRRACRALRDAFLRATDGQPLLLPRLLPLGELDEEELLLTGEVAPMGSIETATLPPAMPPLRRQLLLSRLILQWGETQAEADEESPTGFRPSEDQALRLASELARLLDQVETEDLDFQALADLVPEDYANHWQKTLKFLAIITEAWPKIQAEQGCIGPAERRRRLLEAQAEAWRQNPPSEPVIAAGSTGSIPATAALIATVAQLPQGMVVLPGLDRAVDDETWGTIHTDPTHAQHGLARLLQSLDVRREAVQDWTTAEPAAAARAAFIDLALMPAEATANWQAASGIAAVETALDRVARIDCPGPGEEAAVVALILRRALETPGKTAALVTPDRGMARRVAAELRRWDVVIDDSAGVPLAETVPGSFLRLTAEMVAARFAPLPLLAALKHPLAAGGLGEGRFKHRLRALEIAVLRGPRPAPGLAGLKAALVTAKPREKTDLLAWVEALEQMAAGFSAAIDDPSLGLGDILAAHVDFAERLAASAEVSGAERLWAMEAGEAAALFVNELVEAAEAGPTFHGDRYPALLTALLAGRVVRPRGSSHPRLSILGPLEARLQHFDVMVLSGLNEGTWPAETDPGPWLSRPMRGDFGLPLPERRIGLAAHDFAQAFAAPEVTLTRATRVEGTPTVPSRWLLRIDALIRALGSDLSLQGEALQWLGWAAALDRPGPEAAGPLGPPAPKPPVAARPRRLSVTQIETWMRDPYAIYARHVLGLRPLEPIDAEPGAAERGTLVHRAIERFLTAYPEKLPEDPAQALLDIGQEVFEAVRDRPGLWAFWWPRFARVAHWLATQEVERRRSIVRTWSEVKGELAIDAPAGGFIIRAQADRIDLMAQGGLAILDYKTGAPPKIKEIEFGFAPQLPLEAAIAAAGGFAGVPAGEPFELAFWRLTGGEPAGEVQPIKRDPGKLAADALVGLRRLVATFDDPTTPYRALPRPLWSPRFNDYEHLARVKEWSAGVLPEEGT